MKDFLKKNKIKKPIFIIGCARSGTTVTLDIMAAHHELSWISYSQDKKPYDLNKSIRNNVYKIPFFSKDLYYQAIKKKKLGIKTHLPYPVEPWNFWSSYLSNFLWEVFGNVIPRRRDEKDISKQEIEKTRQAIIQIMGKQTKKRFISKYTGFPRIRYLTQVFPDAKFIHIIRDGRAVAASYLKKIKLGHFFSWDEREWWMSGWPQEWRNEWEEKYRTPITFSAYQWKFSLNEILLDSKFVPENQYIEIKYEDIIKSPVKTFDEILHFCELGKCKRLEWFIKKIKLDNMNEKWNKELSENQKEDLNNIFSDLK